MKYNVSNADRLGDCAWIVGFLIYTSSEEKRVLAHFVLCMKNNTKTRLTQVKSLWYIHDG